MSVNLNEKDHTYVDDQGEIYASVTKVIGAFSQYFDRERISFFVAEKQGITQEELLAEWDVKQQEASEFGNGIHERITGFFKVGPNEFDADGFVWTDPLHQGLDKMYREYNHIDSETTLHSEQHKIAGTADAILYTTRHPKCVVDIHDFKTNIAKGIQFKDPYKKYMHTPLKHLMDCNYNHYALQLSSYAYILQEDTLLRTGQERKIGELAIMFIASDLSIQRIAVPYMRDTVIKMFDHYQKIRGINLNW